MPCTLMRSLNDWSLQELIAYRTVMCRPLNAGMMRRFSRAACILQDHCKDGM